MLKKPFGRFSRFLKIQIFIWSEKKFKKKRKVELELIVFFFYPPNLFFTSFRFVGSLVAPAASGGPQGPFCFSFLCVFSSVGIYSHIREKETRQRSSSSSYIRTKMSLVLFVVFVLSCLCSINACEETCSL